MGFSGGSQDRLSASEVERIRWTVGTAEGAAVPKRTKALSGIRLLLHILGKRGAAGGGAGEGSVL